MTGDQHWLLSALNDPNVTISSRSLMSLRQKFLRVADAAATSLTIWEQKNLGTRKWYDEAFMRGSIAIVMSAFGLESAINEAATLLSVEDDVFGKLNSNPLDKADAIAEHCGFPKVAKGHRTGQHARLLYKIRCGLAHGRAEWSDERKTHADLSAEIVKSKLPLSPFAKQSDRPFPVGCMSSGVACWAVDAADVYIAEYYAAANIS